MKKITAEHPKFDELLDNIICLLEEQGAEIDNPEAFKQSVESVELSEDGKLNVNMKEDAITVGDIMGRVP